MQTNKFLLWGRLQFSFYLNAHALLKCKEEKISISPSCRVFLKLQYSGLHEAPQRCGQAGRLLYVLWMTEKLEINLEGSCIFLLDNILFRVWSSEPSACSTKVALFNNKKKMYRLKLLWPKYTYEPNVSEQVVCSFFGCTKNGGKSKRILTC